MSYFDKWDFNDDDIAPLPEDKTDYHCPQCRTFTNFEDETNLLKRYDFTGFVGERDWTELWRCPVCGKKYLLRNGD